MITARSSASISSVSVPSLGALVAPVALTAPLFVLWNACG